MLPIGSECFSDCKVPLHVTNRPRKGEIMVYTELNKHKWVGAHATSPKTCQSTKHLLPTQVFRPQYIVIVINEQPSSEEREQMGVELVTCTHRQIVPFCSQFRCYICPIIDTREQYKCSKCGSAWRYIRIFAETKILCKIKRTSLIKHSLKVPAII